MLCTRAKVSAGSPASSHAMAAANKRNTEKKKPKPLKKSQYVRVRPWAVKWTDRINARTSPAPHSGTFWRNPNVCPAAKSSRRTAEMRKRIDGFNCPPYRGAPKFHSALSHPVCARECRAVVALQWRPTIRERYSAGIPHFVRPRKARSSSTDRPETAEMPVVMTGDTFAQLALFSPISAAVCRCFHIFLPFSF